MTSIARIRYSKSSNETTARQTIEGNLARWIDDLVIVLTQPPDQATREVVIQFTEGGKSIATATVFH